MPTALTTSAFDKQPHFARMSYFFKMMQNLMTLKGTCSDAANEDIIVHDGTITIYVRAQRWPKSNRTNASNPKVSRPDNIPDKIWWAGPTFEAMGVSTCFWTEDTLSIDLMNTMIIITFKKRTCLRVELTCHHVNIDCRKESSANCTKSTLKTERGCLSWNSWISPSRKNNFAIQRQHLYMTFRDVS